MLLDDPAHAFDLVVQHAEGAIRLAHAALLFARDRYSHLDVSPYLTRMDALARRVEDRGARSREEQVEALRTVLVHEEGLRGNITEFYDPRNSYLNEVLDRRLGIPISLSAIWLDVCHTLEWPFVGIGLPGHFIIGSPADDLWVDPFGGGRLVDRADCELLVAGATGLEGDLEDAQYVSVTRKEILIRMLNNLRIIYLGEETWRDACRVIRRMRAIDPDSRPLRDQLRRVVLRVVRWN